MVAPPNGLANGGQTAASAAAPGGGAAAAVSPFAQQHAGAAAAADDDTAAAAPVAGGGGATTTATPSHDSAGWQAAKTKVMQQVALSQAFDTLRDMKGAQDFIRPGQLKTLQQLGQGAFATVEKAEYTPKGGGKPYVVAVKRLKMELFRSQEDLDLFVQEVELMRKLRHRNIVEFIGAGEVKPGEVTPGGMACEFVVQEFMAGGTLKQLVTREMLGNGRRTYSNADALDICLQMARGLRYLHKSRPMVIHRDLKLENVLLKSTSKGKEGRYDVKLADFGLSRRVAVKREAIALRKAHSSALLTSDGAKTRSQPLPEMASGFTPRGSVGGLSGGGGPTPGSSFRVGELGPVGELGAVGELEAVWNKRAKNSFVARSPPSTISLAAGGGAGLLDSVNEGGRAFNLTGRTGSLMYMAPEVFKEEPYCEKADIFSFGVMMYEVLHRYIMLSAVAVRGTYEELEAYCARIAGGYRPPLHQNWPPSVAKLIADCWAPKPADRPNMDEVVTRLEAIQAAGDLEALDKAQAGCSCAIC